MCGALRSCRQRPSLLIFQVGLFESGVTGNIWTQDITECSRRERQDIETGGSYARSSLHKSICYTNQADCYEKFHIVNRLKNFLLLINILT
jgi:hypothetical protein